VEIYYHPTAQAFGIGLPTCLTMSTIPAKPKMLLKLLPSLSSTTDQSSLVAAILGKFHYLILAFHIKLATR
jgi:hypothetical protein